jgi:hypothetical protein
VKEADGAPRLPLVETVQAVAGRHARLAAGARVEVDLEGVLLPRAGALEGDQLVVPAGARSDQIRLVAPGETLHGGEAALLRQVTIEQCGREGTAHTSRLSKHSTNRRRSRFPAHFPTVSAMRSGPLARLNEPGQVASRSAKMRREGACALEAAVRLRPRRLPDEQA